MGSKTLSSIARRVASRAYRVSPPKALPGTAASSAVFEVFRSTNAATLSQVVPSSDAS